MSSSRLPVTTGASPAPSMWNTENLRLEEPALITRIASDIALAQPQLLASPMRKQHHDRNRCLAAPRVVGAAGEDDGHPGAEHDACAIGRREIGKLLGEHVPRLKIRAHENVRIAGDAPITLL